MVQNTGGGATDPRTGTPPPGFLGAAAIPQSPPLRPAELETARRLGWGSGWRWLLGPGGVGTRSAMVQGAPQLGAGRRGRLDTPSSRHHITILLDYCITV